MRFGVVPAIGLLLLGVNSAPAQTPLPLPKPAKLAQAAPKAEAAKADATKADAKPAESKAVPAASTTADPLNGIPAGERLLIQSALVWSGDFGGAVNGEDPMTAAIKAFQKRKGSKITGTLSDEDRQSLVGAARSREQEFGWSVVVDPMTGVRIGLPAKMVPQVRDGERGTRWSSGRGEIQIETFRVRNTDIAAQYARELSEPSSRRPEYKVQRTDSFFISGLQGLKKFSVRATARDGEVRGFTMLYDQALEGIVAPVMVAMASAFSPFPERSAPFADMQKRVEYGTGMVVSNDNHIVTDRRLTESCQVIEVPGVGSAEVVKRDANSALALLRVYGAKKKIDPLPLAGDVPAKTELSLVGVPDPRSQDGADKRAEVKARLDGASIELRQPVPVAGYSGAAAFDAQGRALGMMEMRTVMLASAEPTAPPVRLVNAADIRGFLARNNVAAPQRTAANPRDAVVRVICVRN